MIKIIFTILIMLGGLILLIGVLLAIVFITDWISNNIKWRVFKYKIGPIADKVGIILFASFMIIAFLISLIMGFREIYKRL